MLDTKAQQITGAVGLAIVLIATFESLRLPAYKDPVGIPTICYGHTQGVKLGQTKTQAECDKLLATDLAIAFKAIDNFVTIPLPDTRRAALASFIYNVGSSHFKNSTLLKKLNAADTAGACAELSKWVYAKGNKLPGLVKRRAKERELCEVGL